MQIETLPLIVLIVVVALVFLVTLAIMTGRSPEVLSKWVTFRADRDTITSLGQGKSGERPETKELQK